MKVDLPKDFVIDSFKSFRDWYEKSGFPEEIGVTPQQYCQYEDLFIGTGIPRKISNDYHMVFQGAKLIK